MKGSVHMSLRLKLVAFVPALLCCAGGVRAQSAQHEIKQQVELLRVGASIRVGDGSVRPSEIVAGVYERRAFVPLWSDSTRRAALRNAIGALELDGLRPEDYHGDALATGVRLPAAALERAHLDLLYTDALVRALRDLRFGRVHADALRLRREGDLDAQQQRLLLDAAALHPDTAFVRMRPQHFVYTGMSAALERLLRLRADGGWPAVPEVSMREGAGGPAVAALRARLAAEGDLGAGLAAAPDSFDGTLAAAVRSYQHRHGLNPDGVVGPATQRELQVPLERRIDQLRVNLERARWVTHDLAPTFVAVNAAGALVYFVRNGSVVFEARAIVGRTYTRTPVFSAQMRYIDVNPTWTVPPGIVHEVLSAIRRNPGYLQTQSMRVIDAGGRPVNPARIDFGRYSAGSFPYVFRQDPGPLNPLGAVKFVFPNRYNVYLHDTPARELFERDERTFSHGCIRVQNPVTLAELVLADPAWPADSLRAAIATGRTRSIPLREPVPVLILYWTAAADLHGELHFYRDIYDRDAAVLRALGERPRPAE